VRAPRVRQLGVKIHRDDHVLRQRLARGQLGGYHQRRPTAKAELLAGRDAAEKALAAAETAGRLNAGDYLPLVTGLLGSWDLMTASRRRDLLSQLISRVVVTRTGYRTPARIRVVPVWESEEGGQSFG
jgi:hypothetical protein